MQTISRETLSSEEILNKEILENKKKFGSVWTAEDEKILKDHYDKLLQEAKGFWASFFEDPLKAVSVLWKRILDIEMFSQFLSALDGGVKNTLGTVLKSFSGFIDGWNKLHEKHGFNFMVLDTNKIGQTFKDISNIIKEKSADLGLRLDAIRINAGPIFGEAGEEKIPVFNAMMKGADNVGQRIDNLGLIIKTKLINPARNIPAFWGKLGGAAFKAFSLPFKGISLLMKLLQDTLGKGAIRVFRSIFKNGSEAFKKLGKVIVAAAKGFMMAFKGIKSGFEKVSGMVLGTDIKGIVGLAGQEEIIGDDGTVTQKSGSAVIAEKTDQFVSKVESIANNIGPIIEQVMGALTTAMTALAENLPTILQNAIQALVSNAGPLIDAMVSAFGSLMDALPDIVSAIFNIATKLIDSLPQIVEHILGAVLGIVEKLPDLIFNLLTTSLDAVFGILKKVLSAEFITGILKGAVKLAIGFVTTLLTMIPQIIANVLEAVPILVNSLIQSIPALIEGLIAALPQLVVALVGLISDPRMITALIMLVPKLVASLIENIPKLIVKHDQ